MTPITPAREPTEPNAYISLKSGTANKTGQRSQGSIHYRILTDASHQSLYLALTANDGGGYFSKEVVPLDKVEHCLQAININTPFASTLLKAAFVSQSANNAGFLATVLRAEQLLRPDPEAIHKHFIQPEADWTRWKAQLLTQAPQASPYVPDIAKPRQSQQPLHAASARDNAQHPAPEPTLAIDDAELDEEEMALLQASTTAADLSDRDEDGAEDPESLATLLDRQQDRKKRSEKRQKPTLRS